MNVDAQEAALGLLSMGHNYFSQPTPSTSSATLNSILTTTTSPVIPQKRKQSALDQQESTHTGNHVQYVQQEHYLHLTHSPPPEPSPRSNGAESNDQDGNDTSTEAVDCICGFAVDDGFSIACDKCSRWCHSACFGIAPGGVPDKFVCWTCQPRSAVEKEQAVRLQRERLGMDPAADGGERDPKETKHRRRSSPGSDRKQRRTTNTVSGAAAVDSAGPGKKKRRPSIVQQPPTPTLNQPMLNGGTEEEQVDVDNEPWREAYVHIAQDIVPGDDTRAKLRRQAAHWRGVTAVSASPSPDRPATVPSSSLEASPPVLIKPLTPQSSLNPFLFQNSNPLVLPPAFALHTTQPIPSHALITPFRSCITPSSSYLADPLNAYAHLGMPKPYVHLMGPPLDLALDARLVGNQGRFARWGCRPNAVLRPVLCERGTMDSDDATLAFGVFATRDLKSDEEIILGWEWDDGNAVHSLPALLEAHETFPIPSVSTTNRPHEIQHLKNQMSNILHALSSTFTTCACGARARECALTQMASFVDGQLIGHRKERPGAHDNDEPDRIDVGPLVGRKRGFRTRERIPFSGGLGGMEMVDESGSGVAWDKKRAYQRRGLPSPLPSFVISSSSPGPSKKGKEKAVVVDDDVEMAESSAVAGNVLQSGKRSMISTNNLATPLSLRAESRRHPLSEPRPPDPRDAGGGEAVDLDVPEDRLPPKMRKKWMHRELEARKECTRTENGVNRVGLGIVSDLQDEQLLMPPPPMPASMDPTTICSTTATLNSSLTSSLNSHLHNHLPPPHRSLHETPHSTVLPSSDSPGLSLPTDHNAGPTSPLSFSSCPASTPSALASFANLSLLSPDLNTLGSSLASKVAHIEKAEYSTCKPAVGNYEQSSLSVGELNVGSDGQLEFKESWVRKDGLGSLGSSSSAELGVVLGPHLHNDDNEDDYSPEIFIDRSVPCTSNLPGPISVDNTPSKPLEFMDSPSHKKESELIPTSPLVPQLQMTPMPVDVSTSTTSGSSLITVPNEVAQQPAIPVSPTSDPGLKPPQKVKMSLKDFALRKKKQREEMALSQNNQASPVIASPSLPAIHEKALETDKSTVVNGHGSEQRIDLRTDEGHTTPWSPPQVVKSDLNGAKHAGTPLTEESTEARIKVDSRTLTTTLNEREDARISSTPPFAHVRTSLVPNFNGYTPTSVSPSVMAKPPLLLSVRQSWEASIPEMKQESIEHSVPSLLQRVSGIESDRSVSPISPDPAPLASRISQEEDGEIGEIILPTTSRTTLSISSKRDSTVIPRPLSRTGPPFSHSPPTGPRNLVHPPTSPTSVRPSTSLPVPNGSSSRLAPTAPRALRQSLIQHHRTGSGPPSQLPSIPPPPNNHIGGSQYIPRGPSADRDRERDRERDRMDWEQRHYRGPPPPAPRWAGGSGRGNPWGR